MILYLACVLSCFIHIQLFATPWAAVHQAPLSMEILQARKLEWVAVSFSICILVTVNNTAMTTGVHVSSQISVFSFFTYISRSGTAISHVSSVFSFLRNSVLFPTVAASIYISTSSLLGFPFNHILTKTYYLWSL